MKCKACDKLLSDREDAATFEQSGTRVELCSGCADWLPPDVGVVGLDIRSRLDSEVPMGREAESWSDEE